MTVACRHVSKQGSTGEAEVSAVGVGDAGGGVEDFEADEVALGVVVEDDAGLVLVGLGDGRVGEIDREDVGVGVVVDLHEGLRNLRS